MRNLLRLIFVLMLCGVFLGLDYMVKTQPGVSSDMPPVAQLLVDAARNPGHVLPRGASPLAPDGADPSVTDLSGPDGPATGGAEGGGAEPPPKIRQPVAPLVGRDCDRKAGTRFCTVGN